MKMSKTAGIVGGKRRNAETQLVSLMDFSDDDDEMMKEEGAS